MRECVLRRRQYRCSTLFERSSVLHCANTRTARMCQALKPNEAQLYCEGGSTDVPHFFLRVIAFVAFNRVDITNCECITVHVEMEPRPPCVLVVPRNMDVAPTVAELDIKGIARHLTRCMDKSIAYVPVFLGCGCARHEVALCKELRLLGYQLHSEMFMDKVVTSATISNIELYTETMHTDNDPRPTLIFSYSDLQSHMLSSLSRYPQIKFIVIGIHAAQEFKLKEELYALHAFFCTCARLSSQGAVQLEYLNYMCKSSMNDNDTSHAQQCDPGSNTWVYHRSWWEHACDGITRIGAARLLQACA